MKEESIASRGRRAGDETSESQKPEEFILGVMRSHMTFFIKFYFMCIVFCIHLCICTVCMPGALNVTKES